MQHKVKHSPKKPVASWAPKKFDKPEPTNQNQPASQNQPATSSQPVRDSKTASLTEWVVQVSDWESQWVE